MWLKSASSNTKKVKERFGSEYSKLIDYLLLLENEKFNAKALAAALNNRDLEDGFFRFELKCAEKNNLVIVTGYSDDKMRCLVNTKFLQV